MIFPLLKGILPPYLTPATWFLVLMNCVIFFANLPVYVATQDATEKIVRDLDFLRTQGTLFSQSVDRSPAAYSPLMQNLASRALKGDEDSKLIIGGLSIRNHDFMKTALDAKFDGDQVAIEKWHDNLFKLQKVQRKHPTHRWGLSSERSGVVNWVSYQFAHSGVQHLLMNMCFLALFGTLLESLIGSSLVMLVYLGSGVVGAGLFTLMNGLSNSPLVGASGAVSGLMACVAVYLWKERVRFFYWLLPVQGYYGFRDLPAWVIAVTFLIPDLAGQISSVPDISGLAYSAHIGGALLGAGVAFALKAGVLVPDPPPTEELA